MSSRNSRGFRQDTAAGSILATCLIFGSWSGVARAADDAPQPEAGAAGSAEGTTSTAEGTDSNAAATSPSEEAPGASPDVQKQQDLKTEKVEDGSHRATAETPEPLDQAQKAEEQKPEDDPHDHRFQFGLRVGVVLGYEIVFRYQSPGSETHLCNFRDANETFAEQQKICGLMAPPALEVAASFAVLGAVEPYVYGRFGFSESQESGTAPQVTGGVGARVYTTTESRLKFFFEPAVALSFEGWNGQAAFVQNTGPTARTPASLYPLDFLVHLGFGAQYDFLRYLGAFANIGFDVGFVRGISTTMGGTIGVQGRFP